MRTTTHNGPGLQSATVKTVGYGLTVYLWLDIGLPLDHPLNMSGAAGNYEGRSSLATAAHGASVPTVGASALIQGF